MLNFFYLCCSCLVVQLLLNIVVENLVSRMHCVTPCSFNYILTVKLMKVATTMVDVVTFL